MRHTTGGMSYSGRSRAVNQARGSQLAADCVRMWVHWRPREAVYAVNGGRKKNNFLKRFASKRASIGGDTEGERVRNPLDIFGGKSQMLEGLVPLHGRQV